MPLILEQIFKFTYKSKIIIVKIFKTNNCCVSQFSKITLSEVIKNKQNVFVEETCWKFQGDEVSGRNEGLGERLGSKVGGGDLVEESKCEDDRG